MRLHLRLKNNLREYRLKSGLSQTELAKFEQLFYLDLCKEVCPADKATEVDISEGSDPGGV